MVMIDAGMMTGRPGVFAGGDMAPGDRTVTAAVGHGKKAARHVDAWLRNQPSQTPVRHPVVAFDQLNLPIYADAPLSIQGRLTVAARLAQGFTEITSGLSEGQALHEAKRCLSCGNCFECDQCYAACPEEAIIKLGPGKRYRFDLDLCTGCGVCFEQCPCHAIEMMPEPAVAAPEQGS
jgi:Pyruvate/2-oxoacid:ferredoxin oxidoreductase delta subunit